MNNPLKQYFRRPLLHIRLPGISKYGPDVIRPDTTEDLEVYPMTSNDEITTRTPDALFNGSAIVQIIQSCVPRIINPWAITSEDLNTILLAIRAASTGDEMDIDTSCPNCKEDVRFGVKLTQLIGQIKSADYQASITINDLKVKFRALNYRELNSNNYDQFEAQRMLNQIEQLEEGEEKNKLVGKVIRDMQRIANKVISSTVASIQTPEATVTEQEYILDFLENCDRKSYDIIREHSIKLRKESEIPPAKMICPHCSHKFEQTIDLNPTNFFD